MKGKKRKRSSPTHSPGAPSPTGSNKSPPPSFLPYQLRSSTKNSSKYSSTNSSPISRMDSIDLLEAAQGDEILELPTIKEAEALLRDDGEDTSNPDPDSPTAAVKSAIEARIAENLVSLDSTLISNIDSNIVSNKDTAVLPTPPQQILPKKPQPLFPEGLPPLWAPKPSQDTQSRNLSKSNATYASKTKTKSPPKARVLVEHILFVYSTWTNKAPINASDWGIVDSHLLGMEIQQDPSEPLIQIANSGFDATHRCGYIACKDLASADWCKRAIRGIGGPQYGAKGAFRAWAKGEQPEARLCRLFFPSRFDSLTDETLMLLLKKHNPSLKQGTLLLKGVDDVQGGRALFVEFDLESYTYVKSKGYRVGFSMMDIDCQLYIPPKRALPMGPGVSGISKLANPSQPPPQSQAQKSGNDTVSVSDDTVALSQSLVLTSGSSVSSDSSASSSSKLAPVPLALAPPKGTHHGDPRLLKRAMPPFTFRVAPTPVIVADNGKRGRPDSALATDGAKKPHSTT